MKFGYFDDAAREYVITEPATPMPWINYLGNSEYLGLISNTAGGYSFYLDARLRRLTRYRYNNVPMDVGGRYLYLRNNQTGEYWSPTWQPTRTNLDAYECRHGMGYTIISSVYKGIKANVRYFIPLNESLEIWTATITNEGNDELDLSLFSFIEFCLWDAADDSTNFQRNLNIGEVEVQNGVIYHKTEYRERRDHYAYFACSEEIAGYDTQRKEFFGLYNGFESPQVVVKGESNNSFAHGWSPVGSHHVKIKLAPGAAKQITFILGYAENPKDQKFDPPGSQILNKAGAKAALAKYLVPENAEAAFNDLRAYWSEKLNIYTVNTPCEHTNRMMNIWNPYQNMVTFNLSRSASYFESGIGRGMGFRDSTQDLLGFVHIIPERARERLLDLAATQLKTGGAYHQYQPLTKRGNDSVGSNFNDDPHWLIFAVAEYLKETGDYGILEQPVQYENEPGSEQPLYHHLKKAVQYTLERIGPHGLPLIGRADWNDCLNLNCFSDTPGQSFQTTTNMDGQTAESIFIAAQFVLSTKLMAHIAQRVEGKETASYYGSLSKDMEEIVLQHGWDGEWFLRAYDNFGEKVGSSENEEGKIFIEPQGMGVMAGIGLNNGFAQKALDSVNQHLATEHGILLHQPAFSQYYLHLGEISSYPPGYKENASNFCHTNPWIMIAETIVGNGNRAHDYYLRINPSNREKISEIHGQEPYVYSQTIAGRDNPDFGLAKNSWLTGTAAYNYVAIAKYILGIRPDWGGLCIQPRVPEKWQGFSATRLFRGSTYNINVKRIGKGNATALLLDGKPINGNVLPAPSEIRTYQVEVLLGAEE
jgi:cellobiose phosphorylase